MKILKLLNKKNFLILFFLFFTSISNAEEKPVDIWNIDKKEIEENILINDSEILNKEKDFNLEIRSFKVKLISLIFKLEITKILILYNLQ